MAAIVSHAGPAAKPIQVNGAMKPAAKAAVLRARAKAKAERAALLQSVRQKVGRMGKLEGKTANTNAGPLCQAVIVRSGLSSAALSRNAGVAPKTVSRLLQGKTRRPSFNTVARVLGAGDFRLEVRSASGG